MHFSTTALLVLSGAVASFASPMMTTRDVSSSKLKHCASDLSPERRLSAEDNFRKAKVLRRQDLKTGPIPVFWNVIYENTTYEGGVLDVEDIEAQIDVLNTDYKTAGISFELSNITYIENARWFQNLTSESQMQTDMKEAWRQGDEATLNIYTVGFFNESLLGYAAFPSDYEDFPIEDGVVLNWSSLPGGTAAGYDLGKTLTHEVGHWAGLYHTFTGGCENEAGGDEVADTPAQADATSGCPTRRDSCADSPGLDPIHNYMDYSDDICLTEFSAGQIKRMQEQMRVYRGVDTTI